MEVRTKFHLIDVCLSAFLFTPLVVLFWHGLFGIFDIIILKDHPLVGPYVIASIGIILQIVFSCFQNDIENYVSQKSANSQRAFLVGYNLFMATIQIMHFRGLNDIYEYFIGLGAYDAVTATCSTIILLCSTRVCSHVSDMPFTLSLDTEVQPKEGFRIDSYYQSEPGFHSTYIIDAIGTIAVIESFVNLFNIAAWIAVDSSFFPSNAALAISLSWLLGHSLSLGLFYFMPQLKRLSQDAVNSDSPLVGTIFLDILAIAQGLGVVMSWHGHFVLYDVLKYYFPITHAGYDVTPFYETLVAFTLLVLCHISSVLVRRGISSDVHDTCLQSLNFDVNYFAHFFNDEIVAEEKKPPIKQVNERDINKNKLKETSKKATNTDGKPRLRKQVSLQELVEIDRKKKAAKEKQN